MRMEVPIGSLIHEANKSPPKPPQQNPSVTSSESDISPTIAKIERTNKVRADRAKVTTI